MIYDVLVRVKRLTDLEGKKEKRKKKKKGNEVQCHL